MEKDALFYGINWQSKGYSQSKDLYLYMFHEVTETTQ